MAGLEAPAHEADAGCAPTTGSNDGPEVACGRRLVAVRPSGAVTVAELPDAVDDWMQVAGGAYMIVAKSGAVWRVAGAVITELSPPAVGASVSVAEGRFAAVERSTGAISIYDLATGARARIGAVEQPGLITMSNDGRAVFVIGKDRVFRWDDPTPARAEDWPAWRARLTNASVDEPSAALRWR